MQNDVRRNQYSFGAYLRWHLLPQVEVTPGFQYLLNPASNPNTDRIWLFGSRLRMKV